jgi:TP901 family phage tail tape measure protein
MASVELPALVQRLVLDSTGFKRGAADAAGAFTSTAGVADANAKKVQKSWLVASQGLSDLGRAGVITGGLLTAAFGASVAAAAKFDREMHNVASISKTVQGDFKRISDQVLEMSRHLPQSAAKLASGLYDIVSSGKDGAEAMVVLEASAKAASAGMTNTAVAAKGISAVLNAYGTSGFEAARVSDILFQTVNKGVLTFEELASNLGDFVGTAAVLKVPIEDAAAALATMTLSGINAAEASTALNRVFLAFIDPSEEMAALLKRVGYESGSAAIGALGLKGAMELLGRETGGNIEAMRALFPEVRGLKGALALLAVEGRNYTTVAEAITTETEVMGATQRAFNEQSKSFSFQLEVAKNNLNALGIEIGQRLLPVLSSMLSGFTNFIDVFSDLPEGIKTLAVILGGIAAAAGLAGGSFLLLAPRVLAAKAALDLLALRAPGVAGAIGGITKALGLVGLAFAAIAVAGAIYSNSQKDQREATEEFRVAIEKERQGLEGATDAAIKARLITEGLVGTAGRLGVSYDDLTDAVKGNAEALGKVRQTGNEIVGTIGKQVGAMGGLTNEMEAGKVGAREFDGSVGRLREALAAATKKVEDQEKATGLLMQVTGKSKKELIELGLATETTGDKIEEAAQSIGLTSKVLAQFGVTSEDAAKAFVKSIQSVMDATGKAFQKDFDVIATFSASGWDKMKAAAEDGVAKVAAAEEKLAEARENLIDVQERQGAANALSVSDAQALRNAEENLAKVLGNSKSTTEQVADARERLADVQERLASKAGTSVSEYQALEKAQRRVTEATDDLAKANSEAMEPLGSMSDEIAKFYKTSLAEAEAFNTNISKAIQMGLDPGAVSRLLQEGPKQAAPILQELVGAHGSALVDIMNLNEKALSKSGNVAVEIARLTQLAVTSKSGQMVIDLKDAMRIAQLQAESGGKLTIGALALGMERSYSDVKAIVDRFGIVVPADLTAAGKAGAEGFGGGLAPIAPTADAFLRAVDQSVKDFIGPLPPTMTTLASQIASNWKVGIDKMPTDTNAVMYLLDQNVRGKLDPLKGYTQNTGNDLAVFWRMGLDPMPGDTQKRVETTAKIFHDAIDPQPAATKTTAVNVVGEWLRELAKGGAGTSEATTAWAKALLDVLNPILEGVGAPQIHTTPTGETYAQGSGGRLLAATGRLVPGSGEGDTVPALLTPGEFVTRKDVVREQGIGAFDALNAGRADIVARYATGGAVPGPPDLSGYGSMVGGTAGAANRHTYDKVVEWMANRPAAGTDATGSGAAGGGQPYSGGDIGSGWEQITGYLDSVGQAYKVTSTVRPGAVTVNGTPSLHAVGKAVDMVGDMAANFNTLASGNPVPGINELFYDPMGFYFDEGNRVSGAIGGHDDHVHAATFDKGGTLLPGWTLAYNGTGKSEEVIPFAGGGQVPPDDDSFESNSYYSGGPRSGYFQFEDGSWARNSDGSMDPPRYWTTYPAPPGWGTQTPNQTQILPAPGPVSVPPTPRAPSFSGFSGNYQSSPDGPIDLNKLADLIEEAIRAVLASVTASPLRAYVVADEVEDVMYRNWRGR